MATKNKYKAEVVGTFREEFAREKVVRKKLPRRVQKALNAIEARLATHMYVLGDMAEGTLALLNS